MQPIHLLSTSLILICCSPLILGADDSINFQQNAASSELFWNFIIAVFVIAVSSGSAALPVAAMKQWSGNWRIAAIVPIAILMLWIAIIVIGRIESPESHRLWTLEIFGWAMLNMVYMVSVMTVKRIIEKAD